MNRTPSPLSSEISPESRVLGVDPGSLLTGYGIVTSSGETLAAIDWGVIRISGKLPIGDRLRIIYDGIVQLILKHRPDIVSVEDVFFAQNVKSALRLGQARAAAILAAANQGVPVAEYSPLAIKQAVVGYGRADKDQVKSMVKVLLGLKEEPERTDASDALAAAICHIHTAGWSALGGAKPRAVRRPAPSYRKKGW